MLLGYKEDWFSENGWTTTRSLIHLISPPFVRVLIMTVFGEKAKLGRVLLIPEPNYRLRTPKLA